LLYGRNWTPDPLGHQPKSVYLLTCVVVGAPLRFDEGELLVLGRYMSDLEVGDKLGPIDHHLTPFLIREYAHSVEDVAERHQGVVGLIAPPTFLHAEKKRMLEAACPEGIGPTRRMHLGYDATQHAVIPANTVVTVDGEVTQRYTKKGREHVVLTMEIRDKLTGQLYTSYTDTSILSFTQDA
jgi:hypothetical protein